MTNQETNSQSIVRSDNRADNQLRPVKITPHISEYAEGSAMIEFGKTKVLCTVSCEEKPPKWLQGTGKGWVTAEYGMLPRSTHTRIRRDKAMSSGRTQEISRLIARSLRAAVDLEALGEKNIIVDCDVINADGGTRTAAITGGFVALSLALQKMMQEETLTTNPLKHYVSAISVGLNEGQAMLDLCYEEDSRVETDMNFVMVDNNEFVEVQGTAEGAPFSMTHLNQMIAHAQKGCGELFQKQNEILQDFLPLK